MAYGARDVAALSVRAAHARGDGPTHLKLRKLLYCARGAVLALKGEPLLKSGK
jgi:uncharacterized phage-associated protein